MAAGRKYKNIVEYFPHFCTSGKTIFILEKKFGNDGYAVWFKTLEILGASENHFIDCRDSQLWEFVVAKMGISSERLIEIYDTLANLETINKQLWEKKVIWSENFVDILSEVIYFRRKRDVMSFDELYEKLLVSPELFGSSQIGGGPQESKQPIPVINPIYYPFDEIAEAWNTIVADSTKCSRVKILTKTRKDKIKSRLKEISEPEQWMDSIAAIFQMVQDSDFLSGRAGKWRASFDWIFENSGNWVRVVEGNYSNNERSGNEKGASNKEMLAILEQRARALNNGTLSAEKLKLNQ